MNYTWAYIMESWREDEGVKLLVYIGLLVFLAFCINAYLSFREEKKYIKMELERSADKAEHRYWEKRLRRLYISKIPVVRSIIFRKYKR